MADPFLHLPIEDRREALGVAADRSGRPAHLLEKDVWVVWALATLYGSALGEHLVFKGGTSLSKSYQVIRRFSEDVDLTYDIRAIAPDLVGENGEALPKTRSEEKRWSARCASAYLSGLKEAFSRSSQRRSRLKLWRPPSALKARSCSSITRRRRLAPAMWRKA